MQFKVPQNIDLEGPAKFLSVYRITFCHTEASSAGRDSLASKTIIKEVGDAV